jgi:hypothetical protein
MKHILTGAAVCAALAFSASVWAQATGPGGNSMGTPGPNPGGPGLTPYTTGPGQAPPPYTPRAAPMAPAPPPTSSYERSAPPPSYPTQRQARTYHKRGATYSESDNNADQLNGQELNRLQAGSYSGPPAPSYAPPPSAPPYRPPLGTTGGGAPYRP